jgi:ubiquinone/menaquinone biosynthesis C-methylase UbiE
VVKLLAEKDLAKLIAVMKSYERKSRLPHYDMWRFTRSLRFKIEELNYVAMEAPKAEGSNMLALDAGCGVGVYSSMLADKGYDVIGLDVSIGMLKKARKYIKNKNTFLIRGSITHLPLRNNKFDLTLCLDTLHHFTDTFLDKAFNEFRRTIKSNGIFITDMRNAVNPAIFLRYSMENKKWSEIGGLTLKARDFMRMKKTLVNKGFSVIKSKGIGFFLKFFSPYIVIVSKAIVDSNEEQAMVAERCKF